MLSGQSRERVVTRQRLKLRWVPARAVVGFIQSDIVAGTSAILLALVVVTAIAVPWIAPFDPNAIAPADRLLGINEQGHWLGTDYLGRDLASRMLWGSRTSLIVGCVPVVLGGVVGTSVGIASGYFGGLVDQIAMRMVDAMLAIPGIIFAIAVLVALGTSTINLILTLSVFMVPGTARLGRAGTLGILNQQYVEAARVVGCTSFRIMLRHIAPNIVGPLVVFGTLSVANMILLSAGLSFLGLGAQPPAVDWGFMIADGQGYLRSAPLLSIVPGLAIFTTTLLINLLGDGLQDAILKRTSSNAIV